IAASVPRGNCTVFHRLPYGLSPFINRFPPFISVFTVFNKHHSKNSQLALRRCSPLTTHHSLLRPCQLRVNQQQPKTPIHPHKTALQMSHAQALSFQKNFPTAKKHRISSTNSHVPKNQHPNHV